ncbi:hypothetical protein GCM10010428_01290 [Actinosynnema pretiosum subsp. pretiosum]
MALQRLVSRWPSAEVSTAEAATSTPSGLIAPVPAATTRTTPTTPAMPPSSAVGRGRSASRGQASAIIASGEVAMIAEAVLVGRSCAEA